MLLPAFMVSHLLKLSKGMQTAFLSMETVEVTTLIAE